MTTGPAMTDYSEAVRAATRIVETKRKMDAVDKNDGYAHQDFNNAWLDHNTAKRLYALQVAEALLLAPALSPPAGDGVREALVEAADMLNKFGRDFVRWTQFEDAGHEMMRLSEKYRTALAADDAGGLPWRPIPTAPMVGEPYDGRTHLVRNCLIVRLAHWHEGAWFITDQGPTAYFRGPNLPTHYIPRDALLEPTGP